MKNLLLTIMLLVPLTAVAGDQSILFEVGIGFGPSGGRADGNDNSKWCKNRNTGRMTFGAIRYRNDNAEVHVARWMHDEDVANCDRDSWAVGVGYVLSTEGDGTAGQDDVYASWTPGVAYTWGEDKGFTGKDRTNTNWRNTGNWQTFNRVAVGVGNEDASAEVAVHRYGTWNPEHGEYFATVGMSLKDLENNDAVADNDRGLEQPAGDTYITNEGDIIEGDTIINEGDTINITQHNTTVDGEPIPTGGTTGDGGNFGFNLPTNQPQ